MDLEHKSSSNASNIQISDRFGKIQNAKRIIPMGSMIGKYQNRPQGPIGMRYSGVGATVQKQRLRGKTLRIYNK